MESGDFKFMISPLMEIFHSQYDPNDFDKFYPCGSFALWSEFQMRYTMMTKLARVGVGVG